MSDTPERGGDGQPVATGIDLKEVDQVMLAALSTRQRTAEILSSNQEGLLDAWVEGKLSSAEANGAVELVQQNIFAAERVLERRLLAAANEGPSVPPALEARLRASDPVVATRRAPLRRPSFNLWQWSGLAGALTAVAFVATIGLNHFTDHVQGNGSIQVDMATIGDRSAFFESSDVRMRGAQSAPASASRFRFRDVDMSINVVQQLQAIADGKPATIAPQELRGLLEPSRGSDNRPLSIVMDAALIGRIAAAGNRNRMAIRVYDLNDPRSADVRSKIPSLPEAPRTFFLTFKP